MLTGHFFAKLSHLVDIRDCGGNKEYRYIYPIGRFADYAVIGVENYRNENKSKSDAFELDAPKIMSVAKEKALQNGIQKHRPKK